MINGLACAIVSYIILCGIISIYMLVINHCLIIFFFVKIRFMELLSQSGQNFQEGDFKIGVSCKQTEKLL